MHRLRTVTYLDVSAVAGHHAMPAALLLKIGGWGGGRGGGQGSEYLGTLIGAPNPSQCQIFTFLTLKTDNNVIFDIELKRLLLEISSNKIKGTYIKLLPPPAAPPPPSSFYAYALKQTK